MSVDPEPRTQAARRARTRSALLETAAHGLATYGYSRLALAQVAQDAGYTRGALYHLFSGKEELTLAVVRWVGETWEAEVSDPADAEPDPLPALLAMARRHADYCRRHDGARVMVALRTELAGQDHPVEHAMAELYGRLETRCARLVTAGRRQGTIPAGPSARATARAYLAVLEAVGIEMSGGRHSGELTTRAARGVLGVPPAVSPRRG